MRYRQATVDDAPAIWAILEDYAPKFVDDATTVDKDFAMFLASCPDCIVLTVNSYPIGIVWFSDVVDDLYVVIHFVIRPKYLKEVLRTNLLPTLIDHAFKTYHVGKLKAQAMSPQKMAIKLLNRFKFKQNGLFRNELKQNGRKVDMFAFELHRTYWNRHKERTTP